MERNKWMYWIMEKRKSILLSGLYILTTVIFIICVQIIPDKILAEYDINVYREIQFLWIVGAFGTAVWKVTGYYIVRNLRIKTQIAENVLLSISVFVVLHKWLANIGATLSMQLCYLLLLAICDVLQIENGKTKKAYKVFIVMSYLLVGDIWGYCANGLWWDEKYSAFSHLFALIMGVVLFMSLSGKIKMPALIRKPADKLLQFLELDEE